MNLLEYANLLVKNRDFLEYFNSLTHKDYVDYYLVYWFFKEYSSNFSFDVEINLSNVISFIKTAFSPNLKVDKNYSAVFDKDHFLEIIEYTYKKVKESNTIGFILHSIFLYKSCFFKTIFYNSKNIYTFGNILSYEKLKENYGENYFSFPGYDFSGKTCIFKETVIGSFLKRNLENNISEDYNFLIEWLTINLLSAIDVYRLSGEKDSPYLLLSKDSGIYTELYVPVHYVNEKVLKVKDFLFEFDFEVINYDVPFIFTLVSNKKNNEDVIVSLLEERNFFYLPTKDCLKIEDNEYILEEIDISI